MSCCVFHTNGGPSEMECDDYGRVEAGATSCEPDYDGEPVVKLHDIDDWDAYAGDPDAECAGAADTGEYVATFD